MGFGLVGVVGGRLTRWAHLSANAGYIINSNPRSEAFGGENVVILDRPNEFVAGIGFDFPVNKHFQLIAELKSIHYVSEQTQNAFQNNPIDGLVGVRVFPRRWLGFSAAYRMHINQQGDRLFNEANFPTGFRESTDPHGFLTQFFIGHRNPRGLPIPPNVAPSVGLWPEFIDPLALPGRKSSAPFTPSASREVTLTADAVATTTHCSHLAVTVADHGEVQLAGISPSLTLAPTRVR